MKVLVLGGAGFVGKHLIQYLKTTGEAEVFASKLDWEIIPDFLLDEEHVYDLDLTDKAGIRRVLDSVKPGCVINLSAQSSVALSWRKPELTYQVNLIGTIHLLETLREISMDAKVLLIGSAEAYGSVRGSDLSLREEMPINPRTPYAVSKVAQEMAAKIYVESYGLDIVMVRAFNHIGPGQSPDFVIPSFAKQIVEIEKGMRPPVLSVGNLEVRRDFTDVRDIAAGYWELVRNGSKGEVYNIGSGESHRLRDLLDYLIGLGRERITVQVEPERIRPTDIAELRADISKIKTHTFWRPQIDIHVTLADMLDEWRTRCSKS